MRKLLSFVIGGLVALASLSCSGGPSSDAGERTAESLTFSTTKGTWTSVSSSPADDSIVFDLLGDLYIVPGEGGAARRVTSGRAWDIEPRFSSDGEWIAFVSDRDGTGNVWIVRPDGSGLAQVSEERFEGLGSPAWSPDGKFIFARQKLARRSLTYKGPWVINRYGVDDESRRAVVKETVGVGMGDGRREEFRELVPTGPTITPDGQGLYFAGQVGQVRSGKRPYVEYQVLHLDLASGELTAVTDGDGGAFRPEISPDGRFLAFGRREDESTSLWVRGLKTGAERRLLDGITRDDQGNRAFDDIIPGYSWTGDSQSIVISQSGGIVRVDVADGSISQIPFETEVNLELSRRIAPEMAIEQGAVDTKGIRWHRLSPDGNLLAFHALGKIWLMELPEGLPYLLNGGSVTPSAYDPDELFEYAPAWSPDGRRIAYSVWGKDGSGHIRTTDLVDGTVRQVTSESAERTNIAFSPGGRMLVYAVALPRRHFLEHPRAEIRTLDLESGEETTVLTTERGVPSPVFSGDTGRIYYVSHTGRRERQFVSVDRQGEDPRVHFELDWLSEAIPSPDGSRVAVVVHDSAYTLDLPTARGVEPHEIDDLASLERRSSAAADIQWTASGTLAWGYGDRFHAPASKSYDSGSFSIQLQVPRDHPRGLVAFTGARIVTMSDAEGGVIERGDLLVENNRIANVGPSGSFAIPEAAHRVDATGKTILPGFVDLHAHPTDIRPSGLIEQQMRGLQADLAYGITTIHDPAVDTWYARAAAELIETGQALGPRFYTAGAQVIGFSGPYNEWIDSLETARIVVERRKRLGAMSIKEYGQPSRIQRQWLAQAAAEQGMRIITEGTGAFHSPLTVAVDGFTGIEHSMAHAPLQHDVIELFAATGVAYDPVLVGPRRGAGARSYLWDWARSHVDQRKLLKYEDSERIAFIERRRAITEFAPSDYVFIAQGRDAGRIVDAGGRVVTGSHGDGITLHFDIWGYVIAGMTPLEAVQTATVSGIRALGLDGDLGSLEPGKLADFLVLDENPLVDIRNTRKIHSVVKNGRVYDDESLDELWPEPRQKPTPHWTLERPDESRGRGRAEDMQ